jgi:hypothetical protein
MNTLAAAVRGYAGLHGAGQPEEPSAEREQLREAMSSGEFPALAQATMMEPRAPVMMFDEGVRAIICGFLPDES